MNYLRYIFSIFFIVLCITNICYAHVTILQPVGGEVLTGNSNFTIKWDIDESVPPNENWDIRFSPDNGLNWKVVTKNLNSTVRQFNWKVPNVNTTQGRIEVIEDRPTGTDDGVRSGPFTIVRLKK